MARVMERVKECEHSIFNIVIDPRTEEPVLNLKLGGVPKDKLPFIVRPIVDSFVRDCKEAGIKIPWINFYG